MESLKPVIVFVLVLCVQHITGSTSGPSEDVLPWSLNATSTLQAEHLPDVAQSSSNSTEEAQPETTLDLGNNVTQGHVRLAEGQDPNDDLQLVQVSAQDDTQDKMVFKDGDVLVRVAEDGQERGDNTTDVISDVRVYGQKVYEGPVCHENVPLAESGDLDISGEPVMGSCKAKAWSWTIDVGEGYKADITLHSLKANQKVGEFLVIGAGSSMDDLWEEQINPIFTGEVNSAKYLRVLSTSGIFSVMLVTNTPTGFKGNFKLSYKRFGEQVTTPGSTTPATTLPPAVEDAETEIVVYVGGLTPVQFGAKKEKFRAAVANMANQYCAQKNIQLVEPAKSGNVVLSLATQCELSWPYSDECVHVNMSVAVLTPESSDPEKYELTVPHLQEMWDTLAPSDSGLNGLELHVYEVPDPETTLYIWLGASLGVLLLFLAFLIFIYRSNIFREYSRMRNSTTSILSHKSSVTSDDSWFPTNHQEIPPFLNFESGYNDYQPAPVPKPVSSYGPPPSYGPPQGYGGAIRFFANRQSNDFDNLAFEEEEEEYTADQTPRTTTTDKASISADC